MEDTLSQLSNMLQSSLKTLKGDADGQLMASLHDHNKLPDKKIAGLASQVTDLLHEIEQFLEPGPLVLADHFLGYVNCKCLCAAVELDIPDILHKGPKTLPALAVDSDANPDRLRQVMCVLYNDGIFSYHTPTDTYSNNATSSLLLRDHWTQWRNWVILYGTEFYDMARGIPESCHKNSTRTPAQINFDTDKDMFTYFSDQGWVPKLHKTLSGGAVAQSLGIVEDYPWGEVAECTLLDVGGGIGALVALLLRRFHTMKAGILDLPKTIEQARLSFHGPHGQFADVGDRVAKENLVAGDFLVEIPKFEVYTMKWCLHDWDDSKALQILSNIRKSIVKGPQSRLIILESLLKDGRMGRLSRYADINMMVTTGGRERTEAQWRILAQQIGWDVTRISPLRNSWPCAIELRPIWNLENGTNGVEHSNTLTHVNRKSHTEGFDEGISLSADNGMAQADGVTPSDGTVLAYRMEAHSKSSVAASSRQVTSLMSFLESWDPSRGNPFYRSAPAGGFQSTNFKWVDHPVKVHDARRTKADFSINKQGFEFCSDPEGLTPEVIGALRSGDKSLVEQIYYPRVEKLVKEQTTAARIIIFDHTLRKRDPGMDSRANPNGKEQPATVVHCDQSAKGALRRLAQNIRADENVSTILKGRVQMINVWRPLAGPVEDWPLAMMDHGSLSPSNAYACDLWRNEYEECGQTMTFTHADGQRWYYLHGHGADEVTMIKIWDSEDGKYCPHAAFKDPNTRPDAPPRESVEVRCLVLHDPGE